MCAKAPVIIIGMHRSGTSMLTRTLQGLGFYMGLGTTRNEECPYTNALNAWVFSQSSATWERPEGVDALLADDESSALVADYLSGVVQGPSCARFLGLRRWLKYRSMRRIAEPWGWKDPRNSYTLPLWLKVFPQARVLHILRHGVDVAQSLKVRREQAAAAAARRYRGRRSAYVNSPFAPKRSGFAHSPRIADLDEGIALWEAYTARAHAHVQTLGEQALELRYEELLAEPEPHLARIAEFCGLRVGAAELAANAARFDAGRAYAYRAAPELVEVSRRHADRLAAFGYRPAD
ncbi:MAG: sulfotransferase [Ectothiorhodospiraceae bacterium]|nr:sulfotransferase [Ectothiorhodospiraceae bacterium]MCH8503371.1 sulfotransferase [Ectothiorhodospiraceae bacterium]